MSQRQVRITKKDRQTWHWVLAAFAALLLLVLAGVGAYHFFRVYQGKRLSARARSFMAVGDFKSASLACRSILQMDPHNAGAMRLVAQMAEQLGDRAALTWRQDIAREWPDSPNDQMALARTALQFDEIAVADSALQRVQPKDRNIASYHETMAQVAIAKKDPVRAREEYAEAVKLDPSNKGDHLNLAVFDLQSTDPQVRLTASKFLQGLLDDEGFRVPAARALMDAAVQRHDPAVVEIARLQFDYPEALFRDRLRCLEVFRATQLPDFASGLTRVEEEASINPAKASDLLGWLAESNQSTLALDWAQRVGPWLLAERPVFVAVADCYVAARDWTNLEKWCRKFEWKDLEFLRHAYLSHALRDENKPLDADLEWSRTLQKASNGEDLYVLQRDAAKWGWKDRATELLWRLGDDRDKQRGALTALYHHYSELSDTGDLYRVASRLAQIAPNDPVVQNNWAQLALLLNVDIENARSAAQRVYERQPANSGYASTYAYALAKQNRTKEALQIMNRLPDQELQKPAIAAYYGIILARAGQRDRAAKFLEAGSQAKLLPEERQLLEASFQRH